MRLLAKALLRTALLGIAATVSACDSDLFAPSTSSEPDPQFATTPSDPVWIGAGDISSCDNDHDEATAHVIDSLLAVHPNGTVFTAGDNVYPNGEPWEYTDCYDPTWGRFKDRTWATIGNHEYNLGNADPTFDYFGDRVGPRDKAYYSLDAGDWHIVMLNSNLAYAGFGNGDPVPAGWEEAQEQWLAEDLTINTKACVLAVMHHPKFYSCDADTNPDCSVSSNVMRPLYEILYDHGVDVLVSGHHHNYERFAPQDPDGNPDPARGIRQFIVGTGGKSIGVPNKIAPNSEVRTTARGQYGVLKLTLDVNAYDWEFVPAEGVEFVDAGTAYCSGFEPTADFQWEATGLSVAFTDTSADEDGTVVAWRWDFGDGTTSNEQNPIHQFASAGSYTVSLTVTDNDEKTGTTSQTVPAGPQLPTADFAWGAGRPLTVLFTDASTDVDGTVVAWSWDFGDGATSTVQHPAHAYATPGSWAVTLTVTDDDGSTGTTTQVVAATGASAGQVIYLTVSDYAASVGGLAFADEDIVAYDVAAGTWSMFFDGSDVGLGVTGAQDLDGISVLPGGDILFSFMDATTIPDVGAVKENDIIRFSGTTGASTSGTLSLYLRGDDFGLTAEDVDAIGFTPDGRLLVSVSGSLTLPSGTPVLDEDLLVQEDATWAMYFDGSDVGLNTTSDEDVAGISTDPGIGRLYLSVRGMFSVDGAAGDGSDIFVCAPGSLGPNTTCTFSPHFLGSAHGLAGLQVIGVSVSGSAYPANQGPTASFEYSTDDLQASFTDTSTDPDGRVVEWNWDFGDGSTSTERNPWHTYAAAGTYTVTLAVADDEGETDAVTQWLAVPTNLAPTASGVSIGGLPVVGQTLTGSYTYGDAENDMEGASVLRWLRDDVEIPGATGSSYTLMPEDEGASIVFEVTPVAVAGTSPGMPTMSGPFGPITATLQGGCPGAAVGGDLVRFEECVEVKQGSKARSITLNAPAGTQAGDLLIAAVSVHHIETFTGPAGWTLIDQDASTTKDGDAVSVGVWWKVADAPGDANHTFTYSRDQEAYGWVMRFTGADPVDPIDAVAAVSAPNAEIHTSPAVTTTVDRTMVLRLGGFHTSKITLDAPGLPGHIPITMDWAHDHVSGGAGYATQATAGSSGTSTFTLNDMKTARMVTVAIKPATGG